MITSRRGELSVLADSWAMSAKALRPLPVAHKPLSEETRVRQRYVDLIVRPQARDMVRTGTVVRSLHDRCTAGIISKSKRRCCNCCTAGPPRGLCDA